MPDWKTHFIFGLFLAILWLSVWLGALQALIHPDVGKIVMLVIFSIFTSLFPDIDIKKSKMRDFVALLVSTVVSVPYVFFFPSSWYYAPIYFVLLYLILKYLPTKHRGITHSVKFSILFSLVLAFLYFIFKESLAAELTVEFVPELILWFFVVFSGYSLHLILDRI